jgi:N-methylhydantoinase A
MAEGISVVSVRRGVDPRRFALLSFGGAAGLHATGVAAMLEMRRVIVPRIASVLSAWGMLSGDLRWELVRTCLTGAGDGAAAEVAKAFEAMEQEARERTGDLPTGSLRRHRSLDMRLGEQVHEIAVSLQGLEASAPDFMEQVRGRFHRQHDELFGYSSPSREPVITNARLSVAAALPAAPREAVRPAAQRAAPKGERRAYFGSWVATPVYDFELLGPGVDIAGPALLESPTTTVVIREGERARVTPYGWLDIEVGRGS